MAAFVGNHECVSVINNFVPKDDVFYYTRKQPFEEKAKLPMNMAKPLYELVMLVWKFELISCYFSVIKMFFVSDEHSSN